MAQLTKTDQIRKLLHFRNAEIARRVGCSADYVRAVRQRTDKNGEPIWSATNWNWRVVNRDRWKAYMRSYMAKRRAEARA
jgi:hypothetical protein